MGMETVILLKRICFNIIPSSQRDTRHQPSQEVKENSKIVLIMVKRSIGPAVLGLYRTLERVIADIAGVEERVSLYQGAAEGSTENPKKLGRVKRW